ncbi:MAG TPA: TRAP transporter large permease subunit, partial [Woeseiaceae bacterium]|nr:TRAP transporter large permease subunit [Woeseiaceae bacterium]
RIARDTLMQGHARSRSTSAINALSRFMGGLAAALVFAMLSMICYDVLMRYVFNSPTIWATEISTYVLVAIALLGTAYAHLLDAHIRVDLLLNALSEPRRRTLLLVAAWIGFIFVAFAAWQSAVMTWENYVSGTRTFSLLYTPIYLPQIPIVVGFGAFALAILVEIRSLSPLVTRWRDAFGGLLLLALVAALWVLSPRPPKAFGSVFDWGSVLVLATSLIVAWLWTGWRTVGFVLGLLGIAAALFWLGRGSTIWLIVAIQACVTLGLLAIGIRVSLALGLVGLLGIYFLLPTPAPVTLGERTWDSIDTFTLTAVPMFVLMGALLLRSGLSDQVFDALAKWLGPVPGGLAHAGVGACGIFAAVSGSSLATAATMGMVACPEMIKRGFNARLAYGSIAAGGTLGILIPPSIAMIIYGSTVGAPIATLFIAGIVPGVLLVFGFMAVVVVWALIDRDAAPAAASFTWGERLRSLWQVLPIVLLIAGVLGILYAGIATPTEAGAMGAGAALMICLARRRLSFAAFADVLLETVRVTSFLFLIIVGASILTYSFDYLLLPQRLVETVQAANLGPGQVMLAVSLLYIVLGMFIDSISMMVMTLPVLFPLIVAMGFDQIWFGVVLVILMEIGLITPPVGVNLFVLRGIAKNVSMRDIVIGVLPFAFVMAAAILLLYWFPALATWLPADMS